MAAVQVTHLASLTQEIAQAMRLSFNGEPVHEVARRVATGTWSLVRCESPDGVAYAILSLEGDCVCIEAVQGAGGTLLAAMIVERAKRHGLQVVAWVFNRARARLAARAGLFMTGVRRMSGSGAEQLQVST